MWYSSIINFVDVCLQGRDFKYQTNPRSMPQALEQMPFTMATNKHHSVGHAVTIIIMCSII